MQALKILGISGSLRRGSFCTAVLRTLSEVHSHVQIDVRTLEDIPLYNADLDGEHTPEGVKKLKDSITAADGLIVCSPEYNYGIPGVLKNAIDWASRPGFKSPLARKPALIITASPGTAGGVRAQHQIREALSATLARPITRQHVAIPSVGTKIESGRLTDAPTLALMAEALRDLQAEIELVHAATQSR